MVVYAVPWVLCFGVFLALVFDRTRSGLPTMAADLWLNMSW